MKIQISQKQAQTLSSQMIASMKILQMGTQELAKYIEIAAQENPVLETIENGYGENIHDNLSKELNWLHTSDPQNRYYYRQDYGARVSDAFFDAPMEETGESLYDHLLFQLHTMEIEPQLIACAEFLAGCIGRSGWLDEDISLLSDEHGQPLERMKQALAIVQSLEPAGVGARNLSECLCLQLKRHMPVDRLALSIAMNHLESLSKGQYGLIARALAVKQAEVRRAADVIRSLEPRPGAMFAPKERTVYVIPDIIVTVSQGSVEPMFNEGFLPSLNISPYYVRLLEESEDATVKDYLIEKVQQAKWMIWAIDHRRNTLLACVKCILDLQQDFFKNGSGHLVPMTLADVAQKVGVHESTISRAVKNKYIQCSTGVYPLNYFFTRRLGAASEGSISSPDAAKALLKKLIAQENKQKPLSDQKLCDAMAAQGCILSRRTVAKYRDELGIPGMSGRKMM